VKSPPPALQLDRERMLPADNPVLGREPHRVRRILCCGVRDYRILHMFQEALAAVDGGLEFVSLQTTDPEVVAEYRRRFCPDFVLLGSEEPPDGTLGIRRLQPLGHCTAKQPESENAVVDRFTLERPLTEKQIAVLQYLRNGCTNRKIAEYMGVQPRTVKDWLKHLYLLFGVSNRTELIATAIDFSESCSFSFRANAR
jgi:DNA-binding CsgD family transcriptional regulator